MAVVGVVLRSEPASLPPTALTTTVVPASVAAVVDDGRVDPTFHHVVRDQRPRSVPAEMLVSWQQCERDLAELLSSVDATEAHTTELWMHPVPISSPAQFAADLERARSPGHAWAFMTTVDDDTSQRYGLATTLSRSLPEADVLLAGYIEVHSRLVAWWLSTAWRADQLARGTADAADKHQTIVAAACCRPLVETAAAFWSEAQRLTALWDDAKQIGRPSLGHNDGAARTRALAHALVDIQLGAKFTDKAPDTKAVFGKVSRTNVLTHIGKLTAVVPSDLQTDYEWLCNTVHPSLGNAFAFSAPPFVHDTGTHALRFYAAEPIMTRSADGTESAERTVEHAIGRSAIVALDVLTGCLDDALHVIDDIALTTGAPLFADFPYWRQLDRPARNADCPCRSGLKAKRCIHDWGRPSPLIRRQFTT